MGLRRELYKLLDWVILAIGLGAMVVALNGCGRMRAPNVAPPAIVAESDNESADSKVRRLEGELKVAKLERDDARLAGARRLLNWCTGILAVLTIGGIVAAVWMRSKVLAMAALSCAAGAAAAQVFQRALDHIEIISWLTLAAVAAVGGWMAWRYHRD